MHLVLLLQEFILSLVESSEEGVTATAVDHPGGGELPTSSSHCHDECKPEPNNNAAQCCGGAPCSTTDSEVVQSGASPPEKQTLYLKVEIQDCPHLEAGAPIEGLGMLQAPSCSPGADSNNDSCYDSDGSQTSSRRNSRSLPSDHQDVSRTVSDTLAAEHTDTDEAKVKPTDIILNLDENQITSQLSLESPGTDSSEELLSVPEYSTKIQFAIKLGYTEEHLKAALKKVGFGADQNELLSELIKLGSTEGGAQSDDEEGEEKGHTDSPHRKGSMDDVGDIMAQLPAGQGETNLRPIVIDGSNVAMRYVDIKIFSFFFKIFPLSPLAHNYVTADAI